MMICNFCKWKTDFNSFGMTAHLAGCEPYQRAQEIKSRRQSQISSIVCDTPDAKVAELIFHFQTEFDLIRPDRFQRLQPLRATLQVDWMYFWEKYQNWRLALEKKASGLRAAGRVDDAERLVEMVLSGKRLDYKDLLLCELRVHIPSGPG